MLFDYKTSKYAEYVEQEHRPYLNRYYIGKLFLKLCLAFYNISDNWLFCGFSSRLGSAIALSSLCTVDKICYAIGVQGKISLANREETIVGIKYSTIYSN